MCDHYFVINLDYDFIAQRKHKQTQMTLL